jgi:hypothetical protein
LCEVCSFVGLYILCTNIMRWLYFLFFQPKIYLLNNFGPSSVNLLEFQHVCWKWILSCKSNFCFISFPIHFQPSLDCLLFNNLTLHHFRIIFYNLLTCAISTNNISPSVQPCPMINFPIHTKVGKCHLHCWFDNKLAYQTLWSQGSSKA